MEPGRRMEKRPSSAHMLTPLTETDKVIIVAYHLPLRVSRSKDGSGYSIEWDDNRGLDLEGMNLPTHVIYIGCIELEITDIAEQEHLEKLLFDSYQCIVLFLEPHLTEKYYHGFCREYLAPLMHNQMHVTEDFDPFKPDEWRAYTAVNQLFAAKVLEAYSGDEMIWIHDYHLMLLPSCIVRKMHVAKIGFFLHAPFPASDVWRTSAVRIELLRSLLNADLVGFLMFEYTRNFLTCCKRLLALDYEFQKGGFLGVEYEGRHVILQVSTFGISTKNIQAHLDRGLPPDGSCSQPVHDLLAACKAGGTVLSAVDFLDRLKGVAPKLLAWEALLRDYPHYRRGYTMVQVCVGARNRIQIQSAPLVEAELRKIVDRINSAYPGAVYFEVRSRITPAERMQLWCASQVMVVTALREAINVHPLEFVLARHLRGLPPGALVCSEFTGFARVLNGCLRCNPNSQVELVETLDKALTMHAEERAGRAARDLDHIRRCSLEAFAGRFIAELKATATKREEDFVCVGFGLSKFRLVSMGSGFKPLDTGEAVESFQRANRRVLLLDWGGTIAPADAAGFYDQRDKDCSLPENVLSALGTLCAHPSCHVMIMSGLRKERVLSAFSGVPNLSLAVEHGFNFRIGSEQNPWQQLVEEPENEWRSVAKSIMDVFASRTHGAMVQAKGCSMLWNFSQADPEFGFMQAKELQTTLTDVLSDFPVVVRTGKGYVEACLKDVNKGAMAERFLQLLEADGKGPVDFVFCAGDDSTDELMFASLNAQAKKRPGSSKVFTVTVGRKPSEASRYLDSHTEVVELLELLCNIGFRAPGGALGSSVAGGGGMGMKKKGGFGGVGARASHTDLASLA